jgi:hypothetical protein
LTKHNAATDDDVDNVADRKKSTVQFVSNNPQFIEPEEQGGGILAPIVY